MCPVGEFLPRRREQLEVTARSRCPAFAQRPCDDSKCLMTVHTGERHIRFTTGEIFRRKRRVSLLDELLLAGRLSPEPGRSHYRLPGGMELVAQSTRPGGRYQA